MNFNPAVRDEVELCKEEAFFSTFGTESFHTLASILYTVLCASQNKFLTVHTAYDLLSVCECLKGHSVLLAVEVEFIQICSERKVFLHGWVAKK